MNKTFIFAITAITFASACGGEPEGFGPDCSGSVDLELGNAEADPIAGPHAFAGTIMLPESIAAGTTVSVAVRSFQASGFEAANYFVVEKTSDDTEQLRYRFNLAADDTYYVYAVADTNQDGDIGAGDLGGHYEITGGPLLDGDIASPVTIAGDSFCNADFALTTIQ